MWLPWQPNPHMTNLKLYGWIGHKILRKSYIYVTLLQSVEELLTKMYGRGPESPPPGRLFFFTRPLQDCRRLLELRHCSNWDSYLEKSQKKKSKLKNRRKVGMTGLEYWTLIRESLYTTTTITNHFVANTQHFIVCLSKVLTKVTLSPTLTLTNHR